MADTVLIVDDEEDFREIMSMRMEARGFDVATAGSADQAMSLLDQKEFDAVVMDFQMPGTDGMKALKSIKAKKPEIQIFLLTGYATADKTMEAIDSGATDLLEKPADIETLSNKIREAKAHGKL